MKQSIISYITTRLFGRKYYANIINTRGTDKCEICCFIFHNKQEAEEHKQTIAGTMSFLYIETVSFRSRNNY